MQRVTIDVYSALLPLVTINILWFLLSLTLILLPPATAALYEVALLSRKGQGPYLQTYLAAVRRWLIISWVWGIATLALAAVCLLAITFYGSTQHVVGTVLLTISLALAIFACLVQFYFWPYMVLQEKPRPLLALRNSAYTVLADPLLILVNAGLAALLLLPGIPFIAPIVVLTPIITAFLGVYSLYDWLEHHHLLPTS